MNDLFILVNDNFYVYMRINTDTDMHWLLIRVDTERPSWEWQTDEKLIVFQISWLLP